MDLDAILRRIQKLLAIANDTRADPNEAAAAASQAAKIMDKFQLDHAQVLAAGLKRDAAAQMGTFRVRANMKRDVAGRSPLKRPPLWAGILALRVARLHDVNTRYVRDNSMGGVVVEFCGMRIDAQTAAWTFDYLVAQMILAVNQHTADHRRAHGRAPDKAVGNAFRTGFIAAVCKSIDAAVEEREASAAAASPSSDSRALALAKASAVTAHFGEQTSRSATQHVTDPAASLGSAQVDVHRTGLGTSPPAELRLGRG